MGASPVASSAVRRVRLTLSSRGITLPSTVSVLRLTMACSHMYRASPDMRQRDRGGRWTNFLLPSSPLIAESSAPGPFPSPPTRRNSMTIPPPSVIDISPSPKAEGVSMCDPMPWPGLYSFKVSWLMSGKVREGPEADDSFGAIIALEVSGGVDNCAFAVCDADGREAESPIGETESTSPLPPSPTPPRSAEPTVAARSGPKSRLLVLSITPAITSHPRHSLVASAILFSRSSSVKSPSRLNFGNAGHIPFSSARSLNTSAVS
mmetsp:Transcript_51585/g.154866  ORF Transcript_51585/g.154866 Transcript_51585/m.154866 type:complete len:263 (+) Transcript_51585:866-1654(+)